MSEDIDLLAAGIDNLATSVEGEREATRKGNRRFLQILAALGALAVGLVVLVVVVLGVTSDTNTAVTKTIPALERQNATLQDDLEGAAFTLTKAVEYITAVCLDPAVTAVFECPPLTLNTETDRDEK